ncbi:Bax inhibitor-1/YccA family protein [Moraxella sp. Tifton1]|uniref:Bax inhibitor-1/YccA family protein n=1 Tax=Moraxella oculi TaxID=2940516 RepID=A0ABW8U6K8_9GAMM|nr:Bax inhibitor-1/YccA family protein [Moraxella sp. Tifton1]MCL1623541.1 Bax inhibitor-1/YccA family protein [Moraxella sp. Tifton1]
MANPIISRTDLAVGNVAMTVGGVVKKSAFLLTLAAVAGFGVFFYALMGGISPNMLYPLALIGLFAGIGLGLVSAFKPHLAKSVAVPYALCEGVLLGAFSTIMYFRYPSVPLSALSATFITAAVMLTLYTTGIIKVTEKFRSIVMSAVIAIGILYLVQLGFVLFGSSLPLLFNGGALAIGFSVFVTIIASLSLLVDFDNVEKGVHAGVAQEYEWTYSIGILSTLVWMYIEFLRLIGYLQDD